jgi:pimeloyl-ACP methyl ester carboxylesterase
MPVAANLYYSGSDAVENNKHRPPVILLHGAGGNRLSWPSQIRRLKNTTIFTIDLPGHGKSAGAGRQAIDAYADDVFRFMKELNIHGAIIVGVSMGSAVALQMALKYPKQVLGLGLIGGGAKMRVAPAILEALGKTDTFETAIDTINENCFSAHAKRNLVQLSKQQMMAVSPPVLRGDFLACNQFDISRQLEMINIPVMIICGSEDRMMPVKFSESLRDEIPHSHLHILKNSGHMVMLEQPDAIADLLKRFIDAVSPETNIIVEE